MSKRQNSYFFKTVLILLLVGIIFVGVVLVNALDRQRYALEEMRTLLKNMQESVPQGNFASQMQKTDSPEKTGPNAQYYDRNAVPGDRLVRAISADLSGMNPLTVNEVDHATISGFVNCSLAELDYGNSGRYEPCVAESWSCSEDRLTWHIKLRKNVFWHDFKDPVTGKEWKNVPVTAHDFKFYVDAIRNPDVDCIPLRGYLQNIKEIKVLNDYEFDVIWSKPYFLAENITLSLTPLPKHFYWDYDGPFDGKKFNDDAERNKMLIGCGPYRLVHWKRGAEVLLERNERYFGRDLGVMPALKTIVFKIVQSPNTRLQAMKSGDLDETSLTAEQWISDTNGPDYDEKTGTLRKIRYAQAVYNYIGLNQRNPLFTDRRVRVALSHLVNRERLRKDIYKELATPTSGPAFINSPCYDKGIKPYGFSIETAKKLFAEAGWADTDGDGFLDKDGKVFRFTLVFPGANPNYSKIGAILKEDFAKAGVQLELMALEWSVVVQRVETKKFDAAMLGWSSNITESDPFQLWHSTHAEKQGSSNFISFKNADCDKIIEAIHQEFNREKRFELHKKLHRLLHEEQPYLFLFSMDSLELLSARYRNVRVFPSGVSEMIFWTPKSEQKTY